MGEYDNREGMPQQPADDQRRQAGQQNQKGERRGRDADEGIEGTRVDGMDSGLEGGVDTGAIEPGDTGQR